MKASRLLPAALAGLAIASHAGAATLSQNFEAGEDTSNWGAGWTGGAIEPAFLAPAAGGANSGGGASDTQSFSRSFKNNTAGLDLTSAYRISLDLQVDLFDGPSGGQFQILDGDFGSGNAANLRVFTQDNGGGNFTFHWQARDNLTGWQDLGLGLDLSNPYRVELTIDPETFTYAAAVHALDGSGNVLNSGSLTGLAFDQNVINNGQNGNLNFYIQASAGGTGVRVDNINIQTVPEPATAAPFATAALILALRRRRKTS